MGCSRCRVAQWSAVAAMIQDAEVVVRVRGYVGVYVRTAGLRAWLSQGGESS